MLDKIHNIKNVFLSDQCGLHACTVQHSWIVGQYDLRHQRYLWKLSVTREIKREAGWRCAGMLTKGMDCLDYRF